MKYRYVILFVLIVLASVTRVYHFNEHFEFLGDQGRDAIVMREILVERNLTLLGPGTSVGSMYLGPLYYYAMLPFFALTYPSPIGPAYAIAVLGVLTVALLYWWGRKMVGNIPATLAALVYSVSPSVVALSRFSWQPNPAPFVGLVMIYATWKALQGASKLWILVFIGMIILTQLHYVALLALVPTAILFFWDWYTRRSQQGELRRRLCIMGISLSLFIVSLLPLTIFDVMHDGIIRAGFLEFVYDQEGKTDFATRLQDMVRDAHGTSMRLTVETIGMSKELRSVNTYLTLAFAALAVLAFTIRRSRASTSGLTIVTLWVATAVVGLSLYKGTIYDHYFGYLFPAVFLLFAYVLDALRAVLKVPTVLVIVGVTALTFVLFTNLYIWENKASDFERTRDIVHDIRARYDLQGRYNITLLNNAREYRAMKYRYFFDATGIKPASQYDYDNLDTLIIITENGEEPLKAPIFEVQQFLREHPNPQPVGNFGYSGGVHVYIYGASQ